MFVLILWFDLEIAAQARRQRYVGRGHGEAGQKNHGELGCFSKLTSPVVVMVLFHLF